jgi:hypothetical protein
MSERTVIVEADKHFLEFLFNEVPKLYDALPEWKKHNLYASKLAMDSQDYFVKVEGQ